MGADEIRIRLTSAFDPTGANAAKRSMADLGRAATILGSGMGGVFAKIGNLAKDLLTGGIWATGARLVMLFFDSFVSPAARAERALERMKRKTEEMHKAMDASIAAMAKAYSSNVAQIDDSMKRREREIDSVKELTKAEIELARQRRIAAGADKETADDAANALLAEVDLGAAKDKVSAQVEAARDRLAAAERAQAAAEEKVDEAERARDEDAAELKRMEKEVYDRTYRRKRKGRRGRYLRSKGRWSYVGKHTEEESERLANEAVEEYRESDKGYQARRESMWRSDTEANRAREEAERAARDAKEARSRLASLERSADALQTRGEAEALRAENERSAKVKDEMERQRVGEERLEQIRARETEERIQEERRERERMEAQLAQRRLADLRAELAERRKAQGDAEGRQGAAESRLSRAWGWYRDKGSMQAAIDEHRAQAAAEVQWKKDFERLKWRRRDWRKAEFGSLSAADEAVRQVAFAKEEKAAADAAVIETARNTRDLAEKLDELMAAK